MDVCITVTLEPPVAFRKFKGADPVDIETLSFEYTRYKIGERKGQRRLEQKCFDPKGKPAMALAKAPRKGQPMQFEPVLGIPSEVRNQIPVIYIGTNRSLKEQLPGARYSLLRQLFEDIDRDLHDPAQTVQVAQPDGTKASVSRAARFRELLEGAMQLLRTEEFRSLETSIKANVLRQLGLDPTLDADKLDFFFAPFDTIDFYKSLDLRVREGAFTISTTELGEGMQNAFVLAILQAFEERRKQGAILLIEEPEMFLHPQMQRSLYKTLVEIGKTNQVIYTTHSPHFVSVPNYHNVVLVRKDENGTTVRRSDLPTDAKRREKLIKELDPERNELFFAVRLLLVEGDTEKLAIPAYAGRFGFDLDRAGATIVEVGGKRNLPEFIGIATSFRIPVGVVYDEDSSDFKDGNEEREFNERLDALQKDDGSTRVWRLVKDYEDTLRKKLGENKYQEQCQRYGRVGKPTRARMIACDPDLETPDIVEEILKWLVPSPPMEPQDDGLGSVQPLDPTT